MVEDEEIRLAERPVPVVPHRSEADSRAIGKEARVKVPRGSHATFEPSPDRPDPVTLLEDQATTRVQELVPDPLRPDAGVALHLLPRRRPHHGVGSLDHPDLRPHGPDLRRCPPVELRRLRLTRAPARLRLQRLRRDAPGTVGVGHQAPGGERRGGRPPARATPSRCGPTAIVAAGPELPGVDAPDGRPCRTSRSGTST